ncbi:MAG: glycosyltransferase family 2 protein [bacterium]
MIFIIIPAFNEEKTIGRVISGLLKLKQDLIGISNGFTESNIIVVDDGSGDNTGEIAKKFGVAVLKHEINRGQGAALQTGHEYAIMKNASIVVDFDADDQFSAHDIIIGIREMKVNGADVVFGSRFLNKKFLSFKSIPWSKRRVLLPTARWFNNKLSGLKLTDFHNGFRIMNYFALKKIKIFQDRMAHNSEITAQIKKHNLKYIEIPVEVRYHNYGQGIAGGLKIVSELIIGGFD